MTKIIDAEITLTHSDIQDQNDFVAIGRIGSDKSIRINLYELAKVIGDRSYIISGNTKLEVFAGVNGYAEYEVNNVLRLTLRESALEPASNNAYDLGTIAKKIKDLHIAGGIELGSDAVGDIYYRNASGNLTRLPKGDENQILTIDSNIPKWRNELDKLLGQGIAKRVTSWKDEDSITVAPALVSSDGFSLAYDYTIELGADIYDIDHLFNIYEIFTETNPVTDDTGIIILGDLRVLNLLGFDHKVDIGGIVREVNGKLYKQLFSDLIEELDPYYYAKATNKVVISKTISEVRAIANTDISLQNPAIFISNNGLEGDFEFDPGDTSTADDGIMTIVSASGDRYKRVDKRIFPEFFGARGDGVTDDSSAFNSFFAYITRGVLTLRGVNYVLNSKVTISNKNVLSGNPSDTTFTASSLIVDGNGARFITTNSTPILIEVNACKRLHFKQIQTEGDFLIVGLMESSFNDCFFKTLTTGLTTPDLEPLGTFDTQYNNKWSNCTIGQWILKLGTWNDDPNLRRLSEFNQNIFIGCKFGYNIVPEITPILVYGTGVAQSVTFVGCDFFPDATLPIIISDANVKDVSFIFEGGTYIDKGIGFDSTLKNIRIYNLGVFMNIQADDSFITYMPLSLASSTPMITTSHPKAGSHGFISSLNFMKNGNLRDEIDTSLNFGYSLALGSGGLHGHIAVFSAASGLNYLFFESIEVPFDGYYSLAVIGRNTTGGAEVGSRIDIYNGSSWIEGQYGVVRMESDSELTWDGVTVYLEAGQQTRLQLYTNGAAEFHLYDVSLTFGAASPLIPTYMHYLAGGEYNKVLSDDGWIYWGLPNIDGTYRQGRNGNNLIVQRRESSSWVTKQIITP